MEKKVKDKFTKRIFYCLACGFPIEGMLCSLGCPMDCRVIRDPARKGAVLDTLYNCEKISEEII